MSFIDYGGNGNYKVAIIIKETAINEKHIYNFYVKDLVESGIPKEDIIIVGVPYDSQSKASVTLIKKTMLDLSTHFKAYGVEHIMVADAKYFPCIAKLKKLGNSHGYRFKSPLEGCEDFQFTYGVNYGSVIYNEGNGPKLAMCNKTLADMYLGIYRDPGASTNLTKTYLKTLPSIKKYLNFILDAPRIALDIEAFSLKFWESGIGSVAIATSSTEGAGFLVDYSSSEFSPSPYGFNDPSSKRSIVTRQYLTDFLKEYKGKVYYHNMGFDTKILIAQLFLDLRSPSYKAQLRGLDVLFQNAHCTKILTYLATNNCTKNTLDLKSNAQEKYGDWAEGDVKDISLIEDTDLIDYNITDACATLYLADKYLPIVEADNQLDIYNNLYRPFVKQSTNAELTGMPMRRSTIEKNKLIMEKKVIELTKALESTDTIKKLSYSLKLLQKITDDTKLKTKERSIDELFKIKFRPSSPDNVTKLVYEVWGEPVVHLTDKKKPSSKNKVLSEIIAKYVRLNSLVAEEGYVTKEGNVHEYTERCQILHYIVQINTHNKIISTFFTTFLEGRNCPFDSDIIYLHGNFNSTGTKSGRLSSSDPNLQNIPSNSSLAKLVKECFVSPPNKLFGGADFDSLEDKISALTTKDPNKLKVYTDKYDGHCLRAYSYFKDAMPDIDPNNVDSINSIETLYPALRQDSKGPTFLLTYMGTYIGMMRQFGFTEVEAKSIESNYHELYVVADKWVRDRLAEAAVTGYVTLAFGLRLRTPLLKKYKYNGKNANSMPFAAQKEMKTAGNALGQSYCLLNNRAVIEFMDEVNKSPYRLQIKLSCVIHDAIYLIFDRDKDVAEWVNTHLLKAMSWQNLKELEHPEVKLSGGMEIFYPTWKDKITIPTNSNAVQIEAICNEAISLDS